MRSSTGMIKLRTCKSQDESDTTYTNSPFFRKKNHILAKFKMGQWSGSGEINKRETIMFYPKKQKPLLASLDPVFISSIRVVISDHIIFYLLNIFLIISRQKKKGKLWFILIDKVQTHCTYLYMLLLFCHNFSRMTKPRNGICSFFFFFMYRRRDSYV